MIDLGASSPAKPARVLQYPESRTSADISSAPEDKSIDRAMIDTRRLTYRPRSLCCRALKESSVR